MAKGPVAKGKTAQPDGSSRPAQAAGSPRTARELNEAIKLARKECELAELQSAAYIHRMVLPMSEANNVVAEDPDSASWVMMSSGGSLIENKILAHNQLDLMNTRRTSYTMWRMNPHAHGILRCFEKFIIGREFKLDFADEHRGEWDDEVEKNKVINRGKESDSPLSVRLVWDDFVKRNEFLRRAKEIVRRTFRDGECFIRKFVQDGKVTIRFIEPTRIGGPQVQGTTAGLSWEKKNGGQTRRTVVAMGIEFLAEDIETPVAYHVMPGPVGPGVPVTGTPVRIDAEDVIHVKCLADSNDLRGFPLLESILKKLKDYEQWEEYRMILNKVRTAVALVRKVEGTALQAQSLIQSRAPNSPYPGRTIQTQSGNQEAAFRPGTILTPGPGVTYEFTAPNLGARDAATDGRNILLTIAAGINLPDMVVTGAYSESNYSSAVEARTPAVREWEDWQDFFAPVFEKIYEWVIEAGIEGLNLRSDTDRGVELHWPQIVARDAQKETMRLERLYMNGILSKKTWSGLEGLIYDDEQENKEDEPDDDMFMGMPLGIGAGAGGSTGTRPRAGAGGATTAAKPAAKAKTAREAIVALGELRDAVEQVAAPGLKDQLENYVKAATKLMESELDVEGD